jgi:hypothetical protein
MVSGAAMTAAGKLSGPLTRAGEYLSESGGPIGAAWGKLKSFFGLGGEAAVPEMGANVPNVGGYNPRRPIPIAPGEASASTAPIMEPYAPNVSGHPNLDQVKEILAREGSHGAAPSPEDLGVSGSGHFRSGSNLPGAMMPSELAEPEVSSGMTAVIDKNGQLTGFTPSNYQVGDMAKRGVQAVKMPAPRPASADISQRPSFRTLERGDEFWGPGSTARSGDVSMAGESNRLIYDPQTPTPYIRQQLKQAATPEERDFLLRALRQRYNINNRVANVSPTAR